LKANKNQRLKTGLSFGIFYAIFSILEKLVIKNDFSAAQIFKDIASGLLGGIIIGIICSWLAELFNNSLFVKSVTKIITEPDEIIFYETPANHFKGVEAVGGKLYLTNKRLFFKSHKFNIQNHKLSIYWDEIMHVDRYKALGLVNNGFSVVIRGGIIEKFVVKEIEEWMEQLSEKTNLLQQGVPFQS
jgi:hypothetical protein